MLIFFYIFHTFINKSNDIEHISTLVNVKLLVNSFTISYIYNYFIINTKIVKGDLTVFKHYTLIR